MKFLRMLPHLPVRDLDAEVKFYLALGFRVYRRMPGFASLEYCDGSLVHFGLVVVESTVPAIGFDWKLEVDDIHAAVAVAAAGKLDIVKPAELDSFGRWGMLLRTPNNYELIIECKSAQEDEATIDQADEG